MFTILSPERSCRLRSGRQRSRRAYPEPAEGILLEHRPLLYRPFVLPDLSLPASFSSITTKARPTSFTTSAKSTVNSDSLRIDHHIGIRPRRRTRKPHCLAQTPLHPVALHRAAKPASHSKSNVQPRTGRQTYPPKLRLWGPAAAKKTRSWTPKNVVAPACTRARNRRDATAARCGESCRGRIPPRHLVSILRAHWQSQ